MSHIPDKATIKETLFPVQRVAEIVASRAAAITFFFSFLFFIFFWGGGGARK